jgi:BCD family chlorophyll transporter-like MFS transporter
MNRLSAVLVKGITRIGPRWLPFADAASPELPLRRILRLSLFQIAVGMATVLLVGTLNRVMIVELDVPAWVVALMVSLPFLFAPFRALVGYKSDTHRSVLGWRRVPYIWFGSLLQFGGLAIMPFALLVLSGDGVGPVLYGQIGAALAFLLVGAGLHTTQTAGLALATDLATPTTRARVVALLYVTLLVGMVASGLIFAWLLSDFSPLRLIQVVQGAAVATMALNIVALWKQEVRNPARTAAAVERPAFRTMFAEFIARPRALRFLVAVGLGTAAFNMQDIILEPYGAQVLKLSVASTTLLTALLAAGSLAAFALAARALATGFDPYRLAALGLVSGLVAFPCVIFAGAVDAPGLFRFGTILIGFGGGLFAVSTLTTAMELESGGRNGLAVGIWGAVQASAAGIAIALGGGMKDGFTALAESGALGPAFRDPAVAYGVVYHTEIALLFATLIAIGPLVRSADSVRAIPSTRFGLAEFPS